MKLPLTGGAQLFDYQFRLNAVAVVGVAPDLPRIPYVLGVMQLNFPPVVWLRGYCKLKVGGAERMPADASRTATMKLSFTEGVQHRPLDT